MPTANELLASLYSSEDKVCVIDNDLRTINIPKTITALGVESDDEVHRLNFRMPRYIGETDLSTFSIRINYMNANNEPDIYVVMDKQSDTSTITFSWLVGRHALAYKGKVNFIVCLKEADPKTAEVLREYNTTVASLPVLEGLEVDAAPLEGELLDILAQLESCRTSAIDDVDQARRAAIVDVESSSKDEQEDIKATADYIRSTFGDDYDTTVKQYRTRANAIVETVQGESIFVDDSSNDYVRGLKIFGKTTQVTTTGKQLININQSTKTTAGITFTPNADGSVTIKGTATSAAYYIFDNGNAVPMVNTELVASLSGSDKVYMIVGYFKADGTLVNSIANVDSETTPKFSYPSDAVTTRTFLGVDTGMTVDATVYPMVRLASIEDDTHEPYSGGVASPSPEWSQELVNVESPYIDIYGKNLLKNVASSSTSNGITFTVNEDGSVTVNGTATAGAWLNVSGSLTLGKGTYILSGCPKGGAYSSTYVLSSTVTADYGNPKTFTLEEETSIVVNIGVYSGCTVNNLTFYPMIRLASIEDDTYEPYKERQDLRTYTSSRLPGVPVTSGGNYTDENGQQWICDEEDFERGVYVQRILVQEFTGGESWTINPLAESLGTVAYHIYNGTGDTEFALGLCSHFVNGGQWSSGLTSKTNTFWTANTTTTVFKTDGAQSLDEFRNFIRSEYESGNPVTLYSVLRTPRETPLSDAELAAYNVLHTNYPNTVVLNDAGAHMELKYNADTQTYLENCFRPTNDQVQAAVDQYLEENPASGAKPTASIQNNILIIK